VVDDGSPTSLDAATAGFEDRIDLTLLRQTNAGPASARNHGVERAKGEFLAFTDDDCEPAPDWLSRLAARFAETPDRAIGGRTVNRLPGNQYSAASQALIDYLYGYYNADPQHARFFASNNLAVPARQFKEMGGFDTASKRSASEDRMLCDQWLYLGHRLLFAPEAVVYHAHDLTLRSFWRQHFNYGRGAYCFHQVRAARSGRSRPKIEPLSFYLDLLRHPFNHVAPIRAVSQTV